MLKNLFLIIIFIFIAFNAFGEYRVYQYYVKSKYNFPQKKQAYLVTSTLNPTTYLRYHGGNSSISVSLIRTWICKGNTGLKEVCMDPTSRALASKEASIL